MDGLHRLAYTTESSVNVCQLPPPPRHCDALQITNLLVVCLTKRPNRKTTQRFTAKPRLQALRLVATVEELLDEVVAEGVHHQLCQVVQYLRQHTRHRLRAALVKFALQEPA